MLSSLEFNEFSKSVVLYCNIESRVEGDVDQGQLNELLGAAGWPQLIFVDAKGDVVHQQAPTARTTTALKASASALADLARYEPKAEAGDKKAATLVFIAKLKLRRYNVPTAKKKRKQLEEVTDDQAKLLRKMIIDLEVATIEENINRRDHSSILEAGKKCLAMQKAGRMPTDSNTLARMWNFILIYGHSQEDIPLVEKALAEAKKAAGGNVNKRWEASQRKALEALKKRKGSGKKKQNGTVDSE